MTRLFRNLRSWWGRYRSPAGLLSPYEVSCDCGDVLRGMRQSHFQSPRCKVCGQRVFVLPASPLPPPVEPTGDRSQPPPASVQAPARAKARLLAPVLLAGLGLVLLLLAVAAYVFVPFGITDAKLPSGPTPPKDLTTRLETGRQALGEGNFQLAVAELGAAQEMVRQQPALLTSEQRRELNRLHQQAELLSDLLTDSLGEILVRAAGLEDREWQAVFTRRYKDRGVVFEAEVRRDAAGKYHVAYVLQAGAEPARVELEDLKLLARLPLERPQRLLFGGRLASIRRESPGPTWVVRFEPESGVLLTDAGAATACGLPADEPALAEVLARQKEWLK